MMVHRIDETIFKDAKWNQMLIGASVCSTSSNRSGKIHVQSEKYLVPLFWQRLTFYTPSLSSNYKVRPSSWKLVYSSINH